MRLERPLILIGAGRSGSTLAMRLLDAHSALDFKGETSFLALRLWNEIWYDRFWLNWPRQHALGPRSAADPLPPLRPDELARERARVGRLVAGCFTELLGVDRIGHRVWGFKELWSGLPQYDHDWRAYDAIFPEASWLHLVRHPFDFARSCARWNGTLLTQAYLEDRLRNWHQMLECHRLRRSTGRYHEVRFEDLVARPRECLMPVLADLDLEWEEAMADALNARTMASSADRDDNEQRLSKRDAEALIARVPGLGAAMASLGYRPPRRTGLAVRSRPEVQIDLRDPEREHPSGGNG
ncbi:sulfotransferase [Thioalkalicoccus limnaeus]|uniref:Sulfotransferase n=1 Tax=Thioalkalicoccus limnaeus TaxID=120681 RepID=A0ABV4BDV2_9GAMM